MNSSAQQKYIAQVQATADSADPFDPAAFNREHTPSADEETAGAEATPRPEPSPPVSATEQTPPALPQE
jgi:hypothetical protein